MFRGPGGMAFLMTGGALMTVVLRYLSTRRTAGCAWQCGCPASSRNFLPASNAVPGRCLLALSGAAAQPSRRDRPCSRIGDHHRLSGREWLEVRTLTPPIVRAEKCRTNRNLVRCLGPAAVAPGYSWKRPAIPEGICGARLTTERAARIATCFDVTAARAPHF